MIVVPTMMAQRYWNFAMKILFVADIYNENIFHSKFMTKIIFYLNFPFSKFHHSGHHTTAQAIEMLESTMVISALMLPTPCVSSKVLFLVSIVVAAASTPPCVDGSFDSLSILILEKHCALAIKLSISSSLVI